MTSVISVAAIIDGLNGYIQSRIRSFGSRSFFITRIPPGFTGLRPLPEKVRVRKYLQIQDAQYLKENVPGLDVATAFAQRINLAQGPPDSIRYANEHVHADCRQDWNRKYHRDYQRKVRKELKRGWEEEASNET